MATIFHIAFAADWRAARREGSYTGSTRDRTLADVGFIHCSRADQWPRIRDALYHDATEPLVLLQIDTALLDVPVVEEPGEPGSAETFPHVYGPLPTRAVVRALPIGATGGPAAGGSFSRVFFTEMLVNAALAVLVVVAGGAGLLAGAAVGGDAFPVVGAGLGLVAGIAAARLLSARRHGRAA